MLVNFTLCEHAGKVTDQLIPETEHQDIDAIKVWAGNSHLRQICRFLWSLGAETHRQLWIRPKMTSRRMSRLPMIYLPIDKLMNILGKNEE